MGSIIYRHRRLLCLLFILFFSFLIASNTFAADQIVETTFFGNLKDDGKGCGVFTILDLVLQILTGGVAIVAVVGISFTGVQYLTAGGNETQVTKAKNRIFNIVLGLAAYAVLYVVLVFLLPNFNPQYQTCSKASETEVANYKAEKEKEKSNNSTTNTNNPSNSNNNNSSSNKKKNKSETNKTVQQAIGNVAYTLAKDGTGSSPTSKFSQAFQSSGVKSYESGNDDECHRLGKSCGSFASTVLVSAGALSISTVRKNNLVYATTLRPYMKAHPKEWKNVTNEAKQPGDVGFADYGSDWHVFIFTKNNTIADASHCEWYGKIRSRNSQFVTEAYRYIGS